MNAFLRHAMESAAALIASHREVVPLALGLPMFALIFSIANAALLVYRIRIENEALAWAAQAA